MELFSFISSIGLINTLCFIIGLGLVIFEMFDPGFGVPGITGLVLLAVGVIITAQTLMQALVMVIILIAILSLALVLAIRSATKGRLSRNLVLSDSLDTQSGYISTENLESFVEKEGEAISTLRPSGVAMFDDIRLDVVSEGGYIAKGTKVKVTGVSGRRVVVKEIN